MTLLAIPFPAIDPVALSLGPVVVRWYALAYILGIVLGWRLARRIGRPLPAEAFDDFMTWATLGVILGGRLGYVLFYRPGHYLDHPLEALMVWQGGMSFHGGMLGVVAAAVLFCRARAIPLFRLSDPVCAVVPIGLFFGRIANFINGELWGRPAPDLAWAMVFPGGGPLPRHPSQLYQAGLEGVALFALVFWLATRPGVRAREGIVTGAFFAGYGVARIIGEFFRQPDAFLGFLAFGTTMGQLLSLPMVAFGLGVIWWARRTSPAA